MTNTTRIAELEAEIAKLKKADAEFNALDPVQRLTIVLHKKLCRHNHVDGCSWNYEGKYEWTGTAHAHYYSKAMALTQFCKNKGISTDDAIAMLDLMTSY